MTRQQSRHWAARSGAAHPEAGLPGPGQALIGYPPPEASLFVPQQRPSRFEPLRFEPPRSVPLATPQPAPQSAPQQAPRGLDQLAAWTRPVPAAAAAPGAPAASPHRHRRDWRQRDGRRRGKLYGGRLGLLLLGLLLGLALGVALGLLLG